MFSVKLIFVHEDYISVAKDIFDRHVAHNWFLFEGDAYAVDDSEIEGKWLVYDESTILGYGDLSEFQIIEMVKDNYCVNPHHIDYGIYCSLSSI